LNVKIMHTEANESAVSQVIGVILIVALTVIMAAIIAAYAFGWVQTVPYSRMVIVTVDQPDPTHMFVTYRGGPDHASLQSLTIHWPDGTTLPIPSPEIGKVYNKPDSNGVTAGGDHVIVTGHFQGNVDQVVLDTFI
jgi:hypothetical protein